MQNRYYSLDVFRGMTVALMILVNNPGSWSNIYAPLDHAPWHGCTLTDLVFPFFLFAVGNALSFVMPRFEEKGTPFFIKKVLKRAILIFLIGLLLNWSPFLKWDNNQLIYKPWENVRIMGVLQRIALCYFFASLIVYFLKIQGALICSMILLLLYWLITYTLGNPPSPYSLTGYFGTNLDKKILGIEHLYKGEGIPFDPEGLASTIPAIVQVVFGYLAGYYIQLSGKSYDLIKKLLIAGITLLLVGWLWSTVFPLNKKIWTSSYVIFTTGLAIIVLNALIYLIELKGFKGIITRFFDVFGKNPLFIFVLSGFLPRVLSLIRIQSGTNSSPAYITPLGWFYEHICKPISPDLKNGSLFYALLMVMGYWVIVFILDRKKIYIKV